MISQRWRDKISWSWNVFILYKDAFFRTGLQYVFFMSYSSLNTPHSPRPPLSLRHLDHTTTYLKCSCALTFVNHFDKCLINDDDLNQKNSLIVSLVSVCEKGSVV